MTHHPADDQLHDLCDARLQGEQAQTLRDHLEACHPGARTAGPLLHTERAAAQTLLLPLFHALGEDDQDFVLAALRESLDAAGVAA